MSQPADNPPPSTATPDYEALRHTRPDPRDDAEDQAGSAQGPATPNENAVDEALGGADPS